MRSAVDVARFSSYSCSTVDTSSNAHATCSPRRSSPSNLASTKTPPVPKFTSSTTSLHRRRLTPLSRGIQTALTGCSLKSSTSFAITSPVSARNKTSSTHARCASAKPITSPRTSCVYSVAVRIHQASSSSNTSWISGLCSVGPYRSLSRHLRAISYSLL